MWYDLLRLLADVFDRLGFKNTAMRLLLLTCEDVDESGARRVQTVFEDEDALAELAGHPVLAVVHLEGDVN